MLMNETTANTPHIKGGRGLLPYPVIVSAVSGDVDAMNTVLKYYEGYINTLSTWIYVNTLDKKSRKIMLLF